MRISSINIQRQPTFISKESSPFSSPKIKIDLYSVLKGLSTGEKISRLQYVQSEFEKAASNFDSRTNFNVIIFTGMGGNLLWLPDLSSATPANIQDAIAFTKKYSAFGGATNIYDPLSAAWIMPDVQSIYFLTDGLPTVGKLVNPDAIVLDFKARYQIKAITINTIAFLMGTDPSDNKPATKAFAKNFADATNGVYRVLESDN